MRAVGFRIKSGYAIAVIVHKESNSWRIERREEILLADDGEYGRFPFHPLIELSARKGVETSRRAVAAVKAVAKRQMAKFLASAGAIRSAAIVVGSLIDPGEIANPHIRTHAREGELFRQVVAQALDRDDVPHRFMRDRDAYAQAARKFDSTEARLRANVDRAGRKIVQPWRADEKLAAAGALLVI